MPLLAILVSVHIFYCTHKYFKERFILNVYMKVKSCLSYTEDSMMYSPLTPLFIGGLWRHRAVENGVCHMATAKCNICRVLTPLPLEGTLYRNIYIVNIHVQGFCVNCKNVNSDNEIYTIYADFFLLKLTFSNIRRYFFYMICNEK